MMGKLILFCVSCASVICGGIDFRCNSCHAVHVTESSNVETTTGTCGPCKLLKDLKPGSSTYSKLIVEMSNRQQVNGEDVLAACIVDIHCSKCGRVYMTHTDVDSIRSLWGSHSSKTYGICERCATLHEERPVIG